MGPTQGRAEGEENLPRPAAHTPLDAAQDPIGVLGTQGTLLAQGTLLTQNIRAKQPPNTDPTAPRGWKPRVLPVGSPPATAVLLPLTKLPCSGHRAHTEASLRAACGAHTRIGHF